MGFPIRISADQCLFTTPRSFSQCITSFFASECQGIHQMPFHAWFLILYLYKRCILLFLLLLRFYSNSLLLSYSLFIYNYPKKVSGGGKEVRTPDPLLAKQVLSQLSYTPKTLLTLGRPPAYSRCLEYLALASAAPPTLLAQDSQDVTDKNNKPLLFLLSHPSWAIPPISWWVWEDLNFRPHAYQACALTTWATNP